MGDLATQTNETVGDTGLDNISSIRLATARMWKGLQEDTAAHS